MAPIFSKPQPKEPQSAQEHLLRMLRNQSRPLLNALLEVVQTTLEDGNTAYGKASEVLGRVKPLVDAAMRKSVRVLEAVCCLDMQKYAKGPKPALTGSLPMIFVLGLIAMLYNAFVFGYMPAAGIALNHPRSLLFHAFIFLTLASFWQACTTEPGGIPKSQEWRQYGSPPPQARTKKRGGGGEARWCRKTNAYKPDRAHFCQVLGKPVLRMDHHCPWLGNTVGFKNHKFFFLFLLYANSACSLLGVSVVQLLVQATLPAMMTFCLIGAEGLTLLLSAILVPFFGFHCWLLLRNMTTIEFCETMRAQDADDEKMAADDTPYDLGMFQNICAVMGSNPLLWGVPVGRAIGDGIVFPLKVQAMEAPVEEEDEEAGPEATHPEGEGDTTKVACDSGSESCASKRSAEDENGFLVWTSAAEFTEDLKVGCEFIGESIEEQVIKYTSLCLSPKRGKSASGFFAKQKRPGPRAAAQEQREQRLASGLRQQPAIRVVFSKLHEGSGGAGARDENCDSEDGSLSSASGRSVTHGAGANNSHGSVGAAFLGGHAEMSGAEFLGA